MAEDRSGVIDIETELTCPICTELLYQPLTLLECLHTFCGSCLKPWFLQQASRLTADKPNPFSCPSCRAAVRETRPNPTVTTLLDMYMKANPNKGRTEDEKQALNQGYTPGESVLPKIKRRTETAEEADDRRMIEEARLLSLEDVGIGSGRYQRGVRHEVRDGLRTDQARVIPGNVTDEESARRRSQIGHQNSLRSILSSSDLGDSADMEEEILRQIMEDGILDGIDLNHLSVAQEEELTEKIAEAYRRRHRRRSARPRDHRSPDNAPGRPSSDPAAEQGMDRRRAPSANQATPVNTSTHSRQRPHMLDPAYPTSQRQGRRTSHDRRSQTSPSSTSPALRSTEPQRHATTPASGSADGLSDSTALPGLTRPGETRVSQDGEGIMRNMSGPQGAESDRETERPSRRARIPSSNIIHASSRNQQSHIVDNVAVRRTEGPSGQTSPTQQQNIVQSPRSEHELSPSSRWRARTFVEPSIACKRCGKPNLEFTVHYNCSTCASGDYNICRRCYLTGRGCLHWFGFGHNALRRQERSHGPEGQVPNHSPPHRLRGHQYLRPPEPLSSQRTSTSDPATRLQSGPFCSNCSAFSPSHYWQCEACNEGEWGFCNTCVNTHRCCTHSLLPVALTSHLPSSPTSPPPSSSPQQTPHQGSITGADGETYTILTISTTCDACALPIPPSHTRFHCPHCNAGNYDLCTSCYTKFQKRGLVSADNGTKGWRRCPQGHRMLIIGFEDAGSGLRRILVEDQIGGHAFDNTDASAGAATAPARRKEWRWRDDATGTRHSRSASSSHQPDHHQSSPAQQTVAPPPSGGRGMYVYALWSYWPQEGSEDELAFPRGAEIQECEDINEDWFFGWYCGRKGLFPGGYVRVLGRVD